MLLLASASVNEWPTHRTGFALQTFEVCACGEEFRGPSLLLAGWPGQEANSPFATLVFNLLPLQLSKRNTKVAKSAKGESDEARKSPLPSLPSH